MQARLSAGAFALVLVALFAWMETRARIAEAEAATHLRAIEFLQHELDVRNGWNETGDLLSPVTSPMALTLMEEYQPHVIEWLPFSLN